MNPNQKSTKNRKREMVTFLSNENMLLLHMWYRLKFSLVFTNSNVVSSPF